MSLHLAVILDNVRSVHNVGSIFRTADGAGFEKVYCCGITPGPLDRFKHVRPDFAKVALDAEKSVAWEILPGTIEAVERLRGDGWKIFAVEQARNSVPYDAIPSGAGEKIALVMGAEVEGVSPEVLRVVDGVLEIPMRGAKESLNVGVAFGIVAYDILRKHDAA